ncbi:MAG: quinone-dependent dihydroorotate dehydrogenase [Saprospiraceae bacterium]|nr:quinone-dependent dihydroorotate dehydrogenase [Saprospiraceae bacterium]
MWKILRSLLFLFNAETAHYLSMNLLSMAMNIPIVSGLLIKSFSTKQGLSELIIDGIRYKNPLGLAAGFDKDGRWLSILSRIGFGFIEVGTVTPLAQPGNPRPRLFRLKNDEGIINRMGFNNSGVDALVTRLKKFKNRNGIIIGGNIGKNKNTPQEKSTEDYLICFESLFDYVDFFVVNVSSPNTPNLRALQEREPLSNLLHQLQKANQVKAKPKPIYLKIAPDLSSLVLQDIIEVVIESGIQGIVANNTTISRPNSLIDKELAKEQGGLSGSPLTLQSQNILNQLTNKKKFTIINVGGIMNSEEALYRLSHGADLIQIYSGFIYRGPWFVKEIINRIIQIPK